MPKCRYAIRNYLGQEKRELVELGHFEKRFVKNTRKRGRTGKYFGNFSPRYS